MAITDLRKFSVPIAGAGTNASLLMPKLKYRFRVALTGFGASDSRVLTKQVMNVSRPGVSFDNVELNVYNSKINYAGRYSWTDISLVVRDDINQEVSRAVGEQIQKQFDFMEQSSAPSGADYKFTMMIEMLDGGNGNNIEAKVLETFELNGCYLQSTVYSAMDYSSSEAVDITMTIKYDNAQQLKGGIAVGLGNSLGAAVRNGVLAV
jgi:hypothetical protein